MSPSAASTPDIDSFERRRTEALDAAARGDSARARAVLEAVLLEDGAPVLEIVSDLAALALREGDLVCAIRYARQVMSAQPHHDAAHITLALALAAIGSYMEATQLLLDLTSGERGARFAKQFPDLAALASSELQRLRALIPPTPTVVAQPTLSHLRVRTGT